MIIKIELIMQANDFSDAWNRLREGDLFSTTDLVMKNMEDGKTKTVVIETDMSGIKWWVPLAQDEEEE